ncbi:MAG: hypothetical protein QG670_775 [Thermoproteota archaeon]|nr:hypothetical protein [Thermoproteota archaeon]
MAGLPIKDDILSEEKNFSYCATLSEIGTQSKRSSHLEDFFPLMNQASIAWVDIKVDDLQKEATGIAIKAGFSNEIVKQLLTRSTEGSQFHGGYFDFDTEMGLLFPVIRVIGFNVTISPLLVLLKNGLILTIRNRETHIYRNLHRYAETYFRRLPQDLEVVDWLTLVLIRIIDENNERNFDQLQKIDEGSEDLTKNLRSDNCTRDVGDQIVHMKQAVVSYFSGLWETLDTINSLRNGDADLMSCEAQVLDKTSLMVREVRDQLSLVEHLSEILASSLECFQSIFNNQLQEKNNLLQDRNNLLQEKNNQLADLNNTLQERNNLLQERNNQLQEYSNQLAEKNNHLQLTNNQLTSVNNRISVLNNKLTLLGGFLAIIAAGFVVPNTIATMLSQTNIFQFSPADMGWYLALIFISTIIATLVVWIWVKKKGLLPKKEEGESLIIESGNQRDA